MKLYDRRLTSKKLSKTRFIDNLGSWLLIVPSVLLFILVIWRPIISGIYLSFFNMKGYEIVEFAGFDNYIRIWSDTQFLATVANTFKYVFWSLVIGFLPPLIFAIMVNEMVHLQGTFKFSMYLPSILPPIAGAMLWKLMYYPDNTGLINIIIGKFGAAPLQFLQNPKMTIFWIVISGTWMSFGGTMLIYLASLQGISRELYEAAVLDGAGFRQRIVHIIVPKMWGVSLLFLVKQVISTFQILEQPLTMTGGGPNNASLSLGLQGYRYAFQYLQLDNAMANNVTMFLIICVITVFYFLLERKVDTD